MSESDEYYKVLWVEDDVQLTKSLPLIAEKDWLNLIPFPCWDDAKIELEKNFDSWDAVILDAKCKQHREDKDNAARFLSHALSDIKAICREKGRQLNWYILTGGGGSETESINDLITDERDAWDAEWTELTRRKFYNKTSKEIDMLFKRIKYFVTQSERILIKNQMYKDVFDAMNYCKLASDEKEYMVGLLLNVHKNAEGKTANDIKWELRTVLESIFRAMIEKWGMLPKEFIKNTEKDMVNITWPRLLLSGETVNIDNQSFTYKERIITDVMKYQIKNIINYVGNLLHTNSPEKTPPDLKVYMKEVGNSPYLVYSMTMSLCDIILWFRNYVKAHPYPEENSQNWTVVIKEE